MCSSDLHDPARVIAAAAALQGEGDYLILAVPHQEGEPAMGVLMFLPHLHSFTRSSLARLAARCGYVLVDDSFVRPRQLVYVLRKGPGMVHVPAAADAFGPLVTRYVDALGLDSSHVGVRRLWWERRGGRSGQRTMIGRGRFEQVLWDREVKRNEYREPRSIAVRSLRVRRIAATESPIEIQCSGPVVLFYK